MNTPVTPTNAAEQYHLLLLRTSRIGMAWLVLLSLVEALAYSPRFAERAPFGLPLQYAGPTLYMCFIGWMIAAIWSAITLIRGKGAGATVVAVLCVGFATGTWVVWFINVAYLGVPSRDYLGATLYSVLAALLFTGRILSRGLLVLTGELTDGIER